MISYCMNAALTTATGGKHIPEAAPVQTFRGPRQVAISTTTGRYSAPHKHRASDLKRELRRFALPENFAPEPHAAWLTISAGKRWR
jgi:hypothetical protein